MKKYFKVFNTKDFVSVPKVGEYFRVSWWTGVCILRVFNYVVMFDKRGIEGYKL